MIDYLCSCSSIWKIQIVLIKQIIETYLLIITALTLYRSVQIDDLPFYVSNKSIGDSSWPNGQSLSKNRERDHQYQPEEGYNKQQEFR